MFISQDNLPLDVHDVIAWKYLLHCWLLVRGFHSWPVDSLRLTLVIWAFDVPFVVSLNKLFNKQWNCQWFGTPKHPRDVTLMTVHQPVETCSHIHMTELDSFISLHSLHSPKSSHLPAIRAVQGDCQWPLKNGGNCLQSPGSRIYCNQCIPWYTFRPANHKRAMSTNMSPCLIPHWQSYSHQARTV